MLICLFGHTYRPTSSDTVTEGAFLLSLLFISLQIFQTLEHPLEVQMLAETRLRLNEERAFFMRFVFNIHNY